MPEQTGWYVYGVAGSGVEVLPGVTGVGDPPAAVTTVAYRDLGALVSEVSLDRPLGRPDDLRAHQNLLDAVAVDAPVLPLRFGAVLDSRDSVATELLAEHHDEFATAVRELDSRVQYVLRARYHESPLLRDVLAENPAAARLASEIRELPPDAARPEQLRLGEMINQAVEARREADTREAIERLAPLTVSISQRPPTHEQEAAHLAFLVDSAKLKAFGAAVEELAQDWRDRASVRLLGPMAAYDFVVTTAG